MAKKTHKKKKTPELAKETVPARELMDVVDDQEKDELTTLHNARVAALRVLQGGGKGTSPSAQAIKTYREAAAAEDALVARLTKKHFPSERRFGSRIEAYRWLKARGYGIGRGTFYNHARSGLLEVESDGSVTERALRAYVRRTKLEIKIDGMPGAKATEHRPGDKVKEIEAKIKTLDYEYRVGKYVEREGIEAEWAEQVMAMEANLRQVLNEKVPEAIRLAGGDPDLVPDAIVALNRDFDDMFRELADMSEFEILIEADKKQKEARG